MRPHAYGGYCALENNLPPKTLHAFQHNTQNVNPHHAQVQTQQQQQQQQLAAPYARTTYPPAALHLQHHQQQQQQQLHHHQHQHHQHNLNYLNARSSLPVYPGGTNSKFVPARNVHASHVALSSHFKQHFAHFKQLPQNATPQNLPQNSTQPTTSNTRMLLPTELANAHNYAKLPPPDAVNQQRIHECAGIPLISTAFTQRQRLQRKTAINPLVTQQKQQTQQNWPTAIQQQPTNANFIQQRDLKNVTNISQMAAHAQGTPILLPKAPFWSSLGGNHANNVRQHMTHSTPQITATSNSLLDKSRLCYQNSAPPALSSNNIVQNKENLIQAHQNEITNTQTKSTSCTTNNDEPNKDVNDTCLPRIIKPRKRRKKDRKPANGVFLKLELDLNSKMSNTEIDQLKILNSKPINSLNFNCTTNKTNISCLNQYATYTNTHQNVGNCFCNNCNSLRSIWEYPLRRSLSDSSNASVNENNINFTTNNCSSPVLSTSSACSSISSNSNTNSSTETSSSPVSSLASFTNLKNHISETDNFSPITTDSTRANIVGIIGSKRMHNNQNATKSTTIASLGYEQTKPRHALHLDIDNNNNNKANNLEHNEKTINDGYSDILSGINLADDLFKHVVKRTNSSSSSSSSSSSGSLITPTINATTTTTAESLLTASINEISRQLIETCINEPTTSNGTFSTCSDISNDSGLDSAGSLPSCDEIVFKFDDLNLNFNNKNNVDIYLDFNNNVTTKQDFDAINAKTTLNELIEKDQHNQQFTQNCFDLMWRDLSTINDKNYDLTNGLNNFITNAAFSTIS